MIRSDKAVVVQFSLICFMLYASASCAPAHKPLDHVASVSIFNLAPRSFKPFFPTGAGGSGIGKAVLCLKLFRRGTTSQLVAVRSSPL